MHGFLAAILNMGIITFPESILLEYLCISNIPFFGHFFSKIFFEIII